MIMMLQKPKQTDHNPQPQPDAVHSYSEVLLCLCLCEVEQQPLLLCLCFDTCHKILVTPRDSLSPSRVKANKLLDWCEATQEIGDPG